MKFTSIFFTASAEYLRGLPQRYEQTSKKYQACLNIFYSECKYLRGLPQRYEEIGKVRNKSSRRGIPILLQTALSLRKGVPHGARDVLYSKSGNIHSKTDNIYSKTWNITFVEVLINVTSARRQSPLQVLFRKTYR